MKADVVVIGGGAIGLASAWRLAQRGVAVAVVDPSPGAGASTVAAGMLAPVTEARVGDEALLALDMASWERWPAFAAEVESAGNREVGYRADGTVVAAVDADDRAALDELVARQRSLGLEVTTLRGARPANSNRPWPRACGPRRWRPASGRSTPRRCTAPCSRRARPRRDPAPGPGCPC